MTSATNSRLVKSFFLSEHYCLVYENEDVFADVYLSLPPILQTHCFSAQSLQSHLTWRPFVTLSPFSTFVPNLPWKKMKTKWFYAVALSAVVDVYWGLISWFEVYQDSYQDRAEMSQYCNLVGGIIQSGRGSLIASGGKRQEVSSSSDKICSNIGLWKDSWRKIAVQRRDEWVKEVW